MPIHHHWWGGGSGSGSGGSDSDMMAGGTHTLFSFWREHEKISLTDGSLFQWYLSYGNVANVRDCCRGGCRALGSYFAVGVESREE